MSGDEETPEQTIAEDLVVTKYKMGAEIANRKRKKLLYTDQFISARVTLVSSVRYPGEAAVPCAATRNRAVL